MSFCSWAVTVRVTASSKKRGDDAMKKTYWLEGEVAAELDCLPTPAKLILRIFKALVGCKIFRKKQWPDCPNITVITTTTTTILLLPPPPPPLSGLVACGAVYFEQLDRGSHRASAYVTTTAYDSPGYVTTGSIRVVQWSRSRDLSACGRTLAPRPSNSGP